VIAGHGIRRLSSIYPTYRDCTLPDLSRMSSERWIVKPHRDAAART
jgi:hypothetical protein